MGNLHDEQRWPGAAAAWESSGLGQWPVRLRELDESLWADDVDCASRTAAHGMRACRCVMWNGTAWLSRSDAELPDRLLARDEAHADRLARTVPGVKFVRADGSIEHHEVLLHDGGAWPRVWILRQKPPRAAMLLFEAEAPRMPQMEMRTTTFELRELRDARQPGWRRFEYYEPQG